jgi:hypothetical protein
MAPRPPPVDADPAVRVDGRRPGPLFPEDEFRRVSDGCLFPVCQATAALAFAGEMGRAPAAEVAPCPRRARHVVRLARRPVGRRIVDDRGKEFRIEEDFNVCREHATRLGSEPPATG